MSVVKMKMLRWMSGIIGKEILSNEHVIGSLGFVYERE